MNPSTIKRSRKAPAPAMAAPPAPPKPRPWFEVEAEVVGNVWRELDRISPTGRNAVINYIYFRNLAGV